MKATDLLIQQHDEVKELLQQLGDGKGSDRGTIRRRLAVTLRAHNTTEEELFYPRFEDEAELKDRIDESFREHEQALIALGELERCNLDDPQFDDLLDTVQQLVLEHVDSEENEVIPRIDNLWTNDMLEQLGRAMKQRFDELCETAGAEQRV